MKHLYRYNEITGEYLETVVAQVDPRASQHGETVYFDIPNTTEIKPNEPCENKTNMWNGTEWLVVDDNRGTEYYTAAGEKHKIELLAQVIPEDCYYETQWQEKLNDELKQDQLTNYAKYRAEEYKLFVDPITAEISRLKDEVQTTEILAEIAEKITARYAVVDAIKAKYPKPIEA